MQLYKLFVVNKGLLFSLNLASYITIFIMININYFSWLPSFVQPSEDDIQDCDYDY